VSRCVEAADEIETRADEGGDTDAVAHRDVPGCEIGAERDQTITSTSAGAGETNQDRHAPAVAVQPVDAVPPRRSPAADRTVGRDEQPGCTDDRLEIRRSDVRDVDAAMQLPEVVGGEPSATDAHQPQVGRGAGECSGVEPAVHGATVPES